MSIPEEDVEFLDAYAREQGYASRSAAVHHAVAMLRSSGLAEAYEEAWSEWQESGEAETWGVVASDALER